MVERPAAKTASPGPSRLEQTIRALEQETATVALLAFLFPDGDSYAATPGRYRVLFEAAQQRPDLVQALMEGDRGHIAKEWPRVLERERENARLLHGLAVAFREQALAGIAAGEADERRCVASIGLWALLLCSTEFWGYFSEGRAEPTPEEERPLLSSQQEETLQKRALEGLFSLHSASGHRELAADHLDQARLHLRCLHLCAAGKRALLAALAEQGIEVKLPLESDRLEVMQKMAVSAIDQWCVTLVRAAEKITADADEIARLSAGIRKNYHGGITYLDPFLQLGIPQGRVLCAALEWYNDWCYDLYTNRQIDEIKRLMVRARMAADALATLSTKHSGHKQENQVLSQHFLLRGFTADDPEQAVLEYAEALEWNHANTNASDLLGGSRDEILMRGIGRAIESMRQKQFAEAHEILAGLEQEVADPTRVLQARAGVYFHEAHALAEEGHFRRALVAIQEAKRLEPEEEAIDELLASLEELAPEEENFRLMKQALDAMKKDRYDQAINFASQVPPRSSRHKEARRLMSAAHFHRGIGAANDGDFDTAERDLRRALELNDEADEQRIIRKQLQVLEGARVQQRIQSAIERRDWRGAEQALRELLAQTRDAEERQHLQRNLAQVLNARAVEAVEQEQRKLEPFGEALKEIMELAHRLQDGGGLPTSPASLNWGSECPVCSSQPSVARLKVAMAILEVARQQGSFSVGSLLPFWRRFNSGLCFSCQQTLHAQGAAKQQAVEWLTEATRLDSGADAIRKNLAAIREL